MLFKNKQKYESFNFSTHVNQEKFKNAADQLGYEENEVNEKLFKSLVLDDIKNKLYVDHDILIRHYGLKSKQAIDLFLKDKEVLSELSKIQIPQSRLSNDVYKKIKSTYEAAIEKQEQSNKSGGVDVLSTLPIIFSFFKERSNEELKVIESLIGDFMLRSYLHDHSLIEFKEDLNKMDPLLFEKKYEGCFNGMLQNIIKPVIDKEEFFRWFEAHSRKELLEDHLRDKHSLK